MRSPPAGTKQSKATAASAASEERTPKWERRKDYRPAELLEAALETFSARGYAATRLDDVARAAGVSKGTLYLYYPSKQDLFKAVVRSGVVDWLTQFEKRIDESGLPGPELLTLFFVDFWRQFVGTRLSPIIKLMIAESVNFPEVTRFFHQEVVMPTTQLLVRIIDTGIAAGEFRRVDAAICANVWLSVPVLKAIWMNSFDPIVGPEPGQPSSEIVALQVAMILDTLRPGAEALTALPLTAADTGLTGPSVSGQQENAS